MRKKLIILSTIIVLFLTFAGTGKAQDLTKGFSLKFTGGYGTMTIGDLNTVFKGMNTSFANLVQLTGGTQEGEFKELGKWGFDLEGEFVVKLVAGVGIGIGAGYIEQRSMDSEVSVSEPILFGEIGASIGTKLTAIPVSFSIYYFLPSPPLVNIYINGGIDYYIGKLTASIRVEQDYILFPPPSWMESEMVAKDQDIGFHGGVGIEFNIGSNIGLFVEGRGRYCKMEKWEGDMTNTYSLGGTEELSGTMWFGEVELAPGTGIYQPIATISEDKPSGPEIRNVRGFEVNLSGVYFRGGIRIKF